MHLEISLIISQILAFLVMLWVLKRYAWKPLLKMMEDRKKMIQSEFQLIEDQKKQVQQLKEVYQNKLDGMEAEAKEKIAEAVEIGHKKALHIQEEAQSEAKAILQRAQMDIENEMNKAQKQLKNHFINSVISATQQLISVKLDSEQDKKMIGDLVEKIK